MPWCLVEIMSTLLVPRVQTVRKRFGEALAFQEYTSESHTRFCFVFENAAGTNLLGTLRRGTLEVFTPNILPI